MAHMESLWPRLAELPLVVESCEYDRLLRGSPDSCPGFPPAEGLRTTGEHTVAVDKAAKSEPAVRGCSLPPDEAVAPVARARRMELVPCGRPRRRGGDDRNQAKAAAQRPVA